MRILLLTHHYSPEIGAPQRRWRELVSGLTNAGHQVAVCTPVAHYPHGRAAAFGARGTRVMRWADGEYGERILRLPYVPSKPSMVRQLIDQSVSSAAALLAARSLVTSPPDVVVSTIPGLPMLFAGDAIARVLKVPHVAEIRDAWPDLIVDSHLVRALSRDLLPAPLTDHLESGVIPGLFRLAKRRADHIVVTSERFAHRLRSRGYRKISVIRNTAIAHRPSKIPRNRASDAPLRLLYVGTVGRSQALDAVVRAVQAVPGVELRIVGAGVAKPALEELSGSTDDRVRFYPQTTGAELEELWQWADTGVVSLADVPAYEYTVPSKLFILMARGVHVTGILAGEAAHIVRESGAGHVVPPGDEAALRSLLVRMRNGDIPLRPEQGAQEWLESHTSPGTSLRLYLDVLQGVAR